ncbi:class I SAM-dependent methyltransferase [Paenibacillus sp. WLX2291]|uniref:class I SAM-dependent methyltransferase n=1 Tax=Paenibacillus sp. WLX2291 TaxID=3296934 RepID=UPI003983E3C6
MNETDYQAFYEQVGNSNGWNFDHIRCITEGTAVDLYQHVQSLLQPHHLLLDIGTGGGEALLSLTASAALLVGIDQSAAMINTARRNLNIANTPHVRLMEMDAQQLQFPNDFFDIISCRHAPMHISEAARVLRPGGYLLTQQVAEQDKWNLKQAFKRGQAYDVPPHTLQRQYMQQLEQAGFQDVEILQSEVHEYYESAEDLIFLLQHTPIIPDFGQCESDWRILHHFIEHHTTDKGICTTAARFMIIARLV